MHPGREQVNSALQDLESAWQQVSEDWSNEQNHRKFIVLCQATGQLSYAARRYRHVIATDPLRKTDAEHHIEEITLAALAGLAVDRVALPEKRYSRLTLVAMGVFIAMLGWAAWAFRGTFQ